MQLGEYEKAKGHLEKSLAIQKEIKNRKGEAKFSYRSLGICVSNQLANVRMLENISRNH